MLTSLNTGTMDIECWFLLDDPMAKEGSYEAKKDHILSSLGYDVIQRRGLCRACNVCIRM